MHDWEGAEQMEMIYNWILKLSFFAVLGSVILQMIPDHGLIREPHLKRFIMIVHIRFGPVNWKKKVRKFRKIFSI